MTVVAGAVGKAAAKKALAKKVAKDAAVSAAKHRMEKPQSETKKAGAKALHKTGEVATKAGTTVKRSHKRLVTKATTTYSVRKYHNLLIAMWLTGTVILITSFFQNDKLVPMEKWKKLFAFQFTMFVLSLAVLIQALSKVVAMLSVVIVLAIALTNKDDITNTFNAFSNGLTPPPIGTGVAKGVQKQVPISDITPVVPRNTDNGSNNTIYT